MNELQQLQSIFEGFHLNTNLLTWGVFGGIFLDLITGLAKGYKADREISSSKLRDGGFKKAGILLVMLLAYGLSALFNDVNKVIFNTVQAYYVYTELISIVENLIALDIALPQIIRGIVGRNSK